MLSSHFGFPGGAELLLRGRRPRRPGRQSTEWAGSRTRTSGADREVRPTQAQRGSALLTVLWATAALAAIAFAVGNTVRSEAERASTDADALRAYYLASAAIDRTLLWIEWSDRGLNRPDTLPWFHRPSPRLAMEFPEGEVLVEVIPESSKLNVNTASPEELMRVVAAAGAPEQAQQITQAILDWRSTVPGGALTEFDQYYLSLDSSFRARHSSLKEIEELLLVRGMTPELFYGGYRQDADGRMVPFGGLRNCLSVYGSTGPFDINTVSPQLMFALGLPPASITAIVNRRNLGPILSMDELNALTGGSPAEAHLAVANPMGGGTIWTLRATARARVAGGRLSEVERSVSAMIKFLPLGQFAPPWHVMRWYDDDPHLAFAPAPEAENALVVPLQ